MSHYNDWETKDGIKRIKDCGNRRELCKRMRRVKRWKGVRFEILI